MQHATDIITAPVAGRFGAPMGRPTVSGYLDRKGDWQELAVMKNAAPFHLVAIRIDSEGYDKGGAYWGLSRQTLYGFVGPLTDIRGFVWADSREDAKHQVRQLHPNARFFR